MVHFQGRTVKLRGGGGVNHWTTWKRWHWNCRKPRPWQRTRNRRISPCRWRNKTFPTSHAQAWNGMPFRKRDRNPDPGDVHDFLLQMWDSPLKNDMLFQWTHWMWCVGFSTFYHGKWVWGGGKTLLPCFQRFFQPLWLINKLLTNKSLVRPYSRTPMVNKPLMRTYFGGGGVSQKFQTRVWTSTFLPNQNLCQREDWPKRLLPAWFLALVATVPATGSSFARGLCQ